MKNYIQKYICKSVTLFVGTSLMLTGCSESFLDPDPQTMFEPETVFSTENGIKSVLAICDRQLKRNYVSEDAREMIALPTEYTSSGDKILKVLEMLIQYFHLLMMYRWMKH